MRLALRRALRKPQFWLGAIVLVPTLVWYALFQFGPILESFWFSLVYVLIVDIVHSRFVGLSNFRQLFDPILNPLFGPAMLHTLTWTVLQFLFVLPLSLLLAACLARVTRGRTLYQIAIFLPVITPLVVVALMTGKLFDPETGAINGVLRALGLPTSQWLHDPAMALPLAAAISAWRWLGLYVIILAAGILNIPRDVSDAARVDGASAWQGFWRITLPLLGHVLALVMVVLLVNSLQEYTLPYTLAGGGQAGSGFGPDNALVMMNLALYNQAFSGGILEFGVASAGAVLEFGVILVVSVLLLKVIRPRWTY